MNFNENWFLNQKFGSKQISRINVKQNRRTTQIPFCKIEFETNKIPCINVNHNRFEITTSVLQNSQIITTSSASNGTKTFLTIWMLLSSTSRPNKKEKKRKWHRQEESAKTASKPQTKKNNFETKKYRKSFQLPKLPSKESQK